MKNYIYNYLIQTLLAVVTNRKGITGAKLVNNYFMKNHLTVDQAKQMIIALKGQNVLIKLNKGRNRIKRCKGKVVEVHSNVFVIELFEDIFERISCSYVDVICGEVSLTGQQSN